MLFSLEIQPLMDKITAKFGFGFPLEEFRAQAFCFVSYSWFAEIIRKPICLLECGYSVEYGRYLCINYELRGQNLVFQNQYLSEDHSVLLVCRSRPLSWKFQILLIRSTLRKCTVNLNYSPAALMPEVHF